MRAGALALVVSVAFAARADPPSPLWDDVAHPDRPRCAALVADARRRLGGQSDAAIVLLREAARRCPDRFDAHALLGVLLAKSGAVADARWALERARALAPPDDRDGPLAYWLGFVRSIGGDLAGSVVELRRAELLGGLPAGERPMLYYNLGDVLLALGRLGEAIDAYRRAVRMAPDEVMPRMALAVALDRDGQTSESQAELRRVLQRDPLLGRLYSGRYVFVPPADAHYYVALAEQTRGHFAAARAELRLFLAIDPGPDGPYAARAREHLERVAGVDEHELNYGPGVDGAHAAAALSPIVPELERCLDPMPAPSESTLEIAAPATVWIRLQRVGGEYQVRSTTSPACLQAVVTRAHLAPEALGGQVGFQLAAPTR